MNVRTFQKRIELIFFDMDGVLFDVSKYNEFGEKVAVSTWNAVFDELGIYQEHERLKKLFISGELLHGMDR